MISEFDAGSISGLRSVELAPSVREQLDAIVRKAGAAVAVPEPGAALVAAICAIAPEIFSGFKRRELARYCGLNFTQFRHVENEVRALLAGGSR